MVELLKKGSKQDSKLPCVAVKEHKLNDGWTAYAKIRREKERSVLLLSTELELERNPIGALQDRKTWRPPSVKPCHLIASKI